MEKQEQSRLEKQTKDQLSKNRSSFNKVAQIVHLSCSFYYYGEYNDRTSYMNDLNANQRKTVKNYIHSHEALKEMNKS